MKRIWSSLLFLFFCISSWGQSASVLSYREASKAVDQGDYLLAVEKYNDALSDNPYYLDAYLGLGRAYFYLDEWDESLFYIQKARDLEPKRIPPMIWEARVLAAQGKSEEAKKQLDQILQDQPHNLDAVKVQGEIALLDNQLRRALSYYSTILNQNPSDRVSLLARLLIYERLGEQDKALVDLRKVVRLFDNLPEVNHVAAVYYYNIGDWDRSLTYIKRALSFIPDSFDFLNLQSLLYMHKDEFLLAQEVILQLMQEEPDNIELRYNLGFCYYKLGDIDKALIQWQGALKQNPDSEIIRYSLEEIVSDNFGFDNDYRKDLASYHFETGQNNYINNQFMSALREYRKGLLLVPTDTQGNTYYAEAFKSLGLDASYLRQLEFMNKEDLLDQDQKDELEIYTSLLSDSPFESWDVDQFSVPRDPYRLDLYYSDSDSKLSLYNSEEGLLYLARAELLYYNRLLVSKGGLVSGFNEAFRQSLSNGSDYFVILSFNDDGGSFEVYCDLYLTRTGTKITELSVLRRGNEKIGLSLRKLSDLIYSALPLYGRIIKRDNNMALINLGANDGLTMDDNLQVLKKGSLELSPRDLGYSITNENILGQLTITNIGENIATGTLESATTFDLINPDDNVIKISEESLDSIPTVRSTNSLYEQVLKLK
ncbi:tetratricopeptide repeat protein [Spirochaeta cellobiosiphila]|uniref:tetratricopeptide repeat protein n=1 Tax=Spirochaeta cellobiosiphila TaxID=504483 RepID=UPI00048D8FF2|nr:tetratricopeptide repeat protein [Spirochaeta cellobiosiphila]